MQGLSSVKMFIAHNTKGISQFSSLQRYKTSKKSCFILMKSWMLAPFETHMYFSMEMLWSTFVPIQDSPIDPMQKGDN